MCWNKPYAGNAGAAFLQSQAMCVTPFCAARHIPLQKGGMQANGPQSPWFHPSAKRTRLLFMRASGLHRTISDSPQRKPSGTDTRQCAAEKTDSTTGRRQASAVAVSWRVCSISRAFTISLVNRHMFAQLGDSPIPYFPLRRCSASYLKMQFLQNQIHWGVSGICRIACLTDSRLAADAV